MIHGKAHIIYRTMYDRINTYILQHSLLHTTIAGERYEVEYC